MKRAWRLSVGSSGAGLSCCGCECPSYLRSTGALFALVQRNFRSHACTRLPNRAKRVMRRRSESLKDSINDMRESCCVRGGLPCAEVGIEASAASCTCGNKDLSGRTTVSPARYPHRRLPFADVAGARRSFICVAVDCALRFVFVADGDDRVEKASLASCTDRCGLRNAWSVLLGSTPQAH